MLRYLRAAGRLRHRAGPVDDPARLLHHEAERGRRDGADQLAGVRPAAPVRPGRAGRGLPGADRRAGRPRWPRSPATTRCRCSPTPARRASSPACSRSARYHRSAASPDADVCLIPESAHGTNAASAVLAGLRVVVVKCGSDGADRPGRPARASWTRRPGTVAAIMVTYPSTNGVFEETIGAGVRRGARRRRPGLRGRREPQRAGRAGPAGQLRRGRLAPEPAQDFLHPARRRRSRRRAGRGAGAPGAVPARSRCWPAGPGGGSARYRGRAVRVGRASCRSRGPTSG